MRWLAAFIGAAMLFGTGIAILYFEPAPLWPLSRAWTLP